MYFFRVITSSSKGIILSFTESPNDRYIPLVTTSMKVDSTLNLSSRSLVLYPLSFRFMPIAFFGGVQLSSFFYLVKYIYIPIGPSGCQMRTFWFDWFSILRLHIKCIWLLLMKTGPLIYFFINLVCFTVFVAR